MHWVLIYWMFHSQAVATGNVHFETEVACKAAFATMAKNNNSYVHLSGVCVNDLAKIEESH